MGKELAITSFTFSLTCLVGFLLVYLIGLLTREFGLATLVYERNEYLYMGFLLFFIICGLIGFILGVVSLIKKTKAKKLAIMGIIIPLTFLLTYLTYFVCLLKSYKM